MLTKYRVNGEKSLISRRQFIAAAIASPVSMHLMAAPSRSVLDHTIQYQRQNIIDVFSRLTNDPHIVTAKTYARSRSIENENNIPWQALVEKCSGCHYESNAEDILAGFINNKNNSLKSFQATSINGFMLTNEELFLGQLLAIV